MTSGLFRQEAIEAQRSKLWGDVTLTVPLPLKLAAGFLVLSVAGFGAFVATGSFSHKEHAPGFIAAHEGVANVLASRGGIVSELLVTEGQIVKKGDPLMSVQFEQTNLGGKGVDTAEMKTLHRENSGIRKQVELEHAKADAMTDRLNSEIAAIDADIATLDAQKLAQAKKTALAQSAVSDISGLVAKHIVAQPELTRRQEALLSSQQAELDLQRAVGAKTSERVAKVADLAQLPIDTKERIVQLRAARNDNRLKISQIDAERGYEITAPKDGRVSALQAWVGKTVEVNVPQMSIVPLNDTLTAELFVPAQAIGLIASGQLVHLDLASFPYQKFGFVDGTVNTVSYTLLKPDQSVGPVTLSAPAYRVSVTLKQQSIKAYGQDVALKSDMQLSADIVSDRRSLLDWIIDPLLAALRRSS